MTDSIFGCWHCLCKWQLASFMLINLAAIQQLFSNYLIQLSYFTDNQEWTSPLFKGFLGLQRWSVQAEAGHPVQQAMYAECVPGLIKPLSVASIGQAHIKILAMNRDWKMQSLTVIYHPWYRSISGVPEAEGAWGSVTCHASHAWACFPKGQIWTHLHIWKHCGG